MVDDVIVNKVASIERCLRRVQDEFADDEAGFIASLTRQDAAILNIQRACEAALDLGQHVIRRRALGLPQHARDVFVLLADAGFIENELSHRLQKMVGFRNIAVHEYQKLQLPIVVSIIKGSLGDFSEYGQSMLRLASGAP